MSLLTHSSVRLTPVPWLHFRCTEAHRIGCRLAGWWALCILSGCINKIHLLSAMDLMFVSCPPDSYVEAPTPNVRVLGEGPLGDD